MRAKTNWIVILIATGVLILAGWTVYGQQKKSGPAPAPPRPAWEYKVVSETDKVSLNEMGAQGWELVTVEMGGAQEVYYFKRAK
jgi:lipopolysaccharide export system protein LptC